MNDDEFDKRLNEAMQDAGMVQQSDKDDNGSTLSALAKGMRIGLEFLGGIVAGLAIGYGIDYYAGTAPIFMTIFLFIGFGAGLLNIYRLINNIEMSIGVNRDEFIKETQQDDKQN